MKVVGIYAFVNKINGKKYIGRSNDIYGRCRVHLKNKKKVNSILQEEFDHYGEECFYYGLIEELPQNATKAELEAKETYYISLYNSDIYGYNIDRNNTCSPTGASDSTRSKLSALFTGENNPNYGHYWTPEQKEALSKYKKEQFATGQLTVSEEQRALISAKNKAYFSKQENRDTVAKSVAKSRSKHIFEKYSMKMELLNQYNNMYDALQDNPDLKRQGIYRVCYGKRPHYKHYIWRMENKI